MKKRERLLFVGMVFALGLPIFASNKQDLLKQARDDYYKAQQETINQNKAKEKLEQKMVVIKKYLQDEWQLDLDVLRKEVRSRYPYVVGKDFEGNTVPRKDFSTLNLN